MMRFARCQCPEGRQIFTYFSYAFAVLVPRLCAINRAPAIKRLTWGNTLSLFATGVVLLALFIASYSRRGTWVALGSTALSAAMFVGLLFFATLHEPSQVQPRLAWIANQLSLVADSHTAAELKSAVASISLSCDASQRPECRATAGAEPPPAAEAEPMQAAVITDWPGRSRAPKATSQSPVAWNLDDGDGQLPVSSPWGFSISGTNDSDEALEEVHAVLKPDSSRRELELVLSVEGLKPGDQVIPAGGRFSLVSENPNEDGSKLGGAILSFRYVQAGQRKTSILYLTPAMLSPFANR